jgi:hypothetical protein
VVDLSSDEAYLLSDTSWDEDFIKILFGDLNRGLLGPPDNCKVIIISDSDEEEEEHEEDVVDADAAPPFAKKSPAPTASIADTDDTTKGTSNDCNDSRSPDRAIGDSSSGGDEASSP